MESTSIGLGQLLAGGVLLYGGGEVRVRGAAQLGLRLCMSPPVVDLTVVTFGTSSPELAVSVGAALDGMGDIAVGKVDGSNVFNVLGIVGRGRETRSCEPCRPGAARLRRYRSG